MSSSSSSSSLSSTSHEAFRSALSTGEMNKAIALIEKSSINSRDSGGRTMLHWTALIGGDECITALLQHTECDVNAQDGQGQTALHLALSSRHPSIALLLLTHPSISVSHVDHFQRLPLHWICQHGYDDLLAPCLRGVNINAQTQSGDTALHWACTDAHMGCVQQLLLAGARVDIVNQRGQQPWQVTNDENIIQMVKAHLPTSSYMEDDTTSSISSSSSSIISSTPITSTSMNVPLASKPPEKKKMVIKLKK